MLFFNVGVVACARIRLEGGDELRGARRARVDAVVDGTARQDVARIAELIGLGMIVLYWIPLAIISSALTDIYRTGVYLYAKEGRPLNRFGEELARTAFSRRSPPSVPPDTSLGPRGLRVASALAKTIPVARSARAVRRELASSQST